MSEQPFVIEREFNAQVSKVWDAITNNEKMKKWYFQLPEFKPVVGFEFQFFGGEEGGERFKHLCRVTEVVRGKKIAYSWRYDGYPGDSLVSWELSGFGDKTKLRLIHSGLDSFAASGSAFRSENFANGWTQILDNSLKKFLGTDTANA
jgi:uncharacterized protein YndB with AHSA1/START domain